MGGLYGPSGLNTPLNLDHNPFTNTQLLFLDTLELHDLSRLTNDPIQHNHTWSVVPIKIPTYIPKFDGKNGEDLVIHITTYHLWHVSNLLSDDSIHIHRFLHTLTGNS